MVFFKFERHYFFFRMNANRLQHRTRNINNFECICSVHQKFHTLKMQFMLFRLQMINLVKYYLKIKNTQGQSTKFREQCTYMYMLSCASLFFTVERDIISGKIRTQRTYWYMFFMMQLSFANYNKVYKVKGKENKFSQKYR